MFTSLSCLGECGANYKLSSLDHRNVLAAKVGIHYFHLCIHPGCSCPQGLRIIFSDASRLIFRLSSSSGVRATIRLYAESYERDPSGHDQEPQVPKQDCTLSTVSYRS